ncbi:MAG: proteasome accessory factor PafA2 family protein [Candidatus Omnitrophica bacterium]|nr:proteasome accessory factor PafA2 family protein [Candidatus Omnitrophota bacterium]
MNFHDAKVFVLFGLETEYGFAVASAKTSLERRKYSSSLLLNAAMEKLAHLPSGGSTGVFLPNGSRFYIDQGDHPEISTPETANPWDAVRYQLAGDLILLRLKEAVEELLDEKEEVVLFKGNVCYRSKSTWGSHESYVHRIHPSQIAEQIIPHLASRIIYTGAGGFINTSTGLTFTLSPRVWHLEHETSESSTHNRAIFHTKNEPLCSHGWNRLHLLCGESQCSIKGAWLRMATTALITALIDHGRCPGEEMQLRRPIEAMRRFSLDPFCKTDVPSRAGRKLNAIQIQRHYLEEVKKCMECKWMPDWAEIVCHEWDEMLARLEDSPDSVCQTIDWAIKYVMYTDYLERNNLSWRQADEITHALKSMPAWKPPRTMSTSMFASCFQRDDSDAKRRHMTIQQNLLKNIGMSEAEWNHFSNIRSKMFDIDAQFSILGNKGIFNLLDRQGLLDHGIQGVNRIEEAAERPPDYGRAKLRGSSISHLSKGNQKQYICFWDSIYNLTERTLLDLSDPFSEQEQWIAFESRHV